MKQPTLVVLAAGMGSRFGGLKQMTPVDDRGNSILHYSIYDACAAGFGKVVFVIKHAIEEDFRKITAGLEKHIEVAYVYQETDMLPEGFTGGLHRPRRPRQALGHRPRRPVREGRDRRSLRRHQFRRFLRPRRLSDDRGLFAAGAW